jgi:hypothetical protein
MWGVNVIQKHICDLTGVVHGVTVQTDNGDTQYLTWVEYMDLMENRKNGNRG